MCWQMLPPPHSLHWLLIRLCWQMPSPPQSLHLCLSLLCWQMLPPPQSLHRLLIRACWQMLDPPHSLHPLLLRVCWQMLPLRTPCTGSLSERAGRYPARPSALRAPAPLPIVLAWRPPSCSLFWTKAKASSCSLFWRKAAGLLPSPPCPSTEFLPPEPTECPQRPLFLPPPLPTPPLCPL